MKRDLKYRGWGKLKGFFNVIVIRKNKENLKISTRKLLDLQKKSQIQSNSQVLY